MASPIGKRLRPRGAVRVNEAEPTEPTQELAWFVDEFIHQRLTIVLDKDERKLQLEQKRQQLERQRAEQFHKSLNSFFNTMRKSVNTWTFVILWAVIACAGGWIGGINTPLGVTCSARTSLCYQARIRGMKTAIAELPKPQCTKTRKGYICILPSDGTKAKR